MRDINKAIRDIKNIFNVDSFPAGFLEKYDQLECLADSHGTETYLVQQKISKQLYVAKCYDKNIYSDIQESNILRSLHHSGLPAFSDEFQNEFMFCVVREYIEGESIDRYIKENCPTEKEILHICVQLCDILSCLHNQRPPVIHRDIKPQNVIMTDDGQVVLIDFDIARFYNDAAETDTRFCGTREYAPPEQYGFSQTDSRADTYSLGVLLGWMLTRETDVKKAVRKLEDPLATVYRKCTSFSPESRYASAEKLKSALLYIDSKYKKSVAKWIASVLCCMALICAGFSIGRYTDFLSAVLNPQLDVTFEEPLVEQAVRLQLGKNEDETINKDDLLSITELYIFGDLIAKTEAELNDEAKRLFDNNQMKEGPIRSLADLTKLPNLKCVMICMQQITDISPLAALANLEIVGIKNNPISDIAPLGQLHFLERVSLFDTLVTDLSPLALCPMLTELDAGKLPFRSLQPFEGLKRIKRLSLYETTLDTLSGIEQLTQLSFFEISGVVDGDLSPLLSLQLLETVALDESLRFAADAISEKAAFSISYR